MWEMISHMASDRMWIYTSIVGSIFGAAALFYFKDTRMGLWGYAKFDGALDFLRDRYGWSWLNQDPDAWRKVYPQIAVKFDELEARLDELKLDCERIDNQDNSAN